VQVGSPKYPKSSGRHIGRRDASIVILACR
jgi:hypothetical protein